MDQDQQRDFAEEADAAEQLRPESELEDSSEIFEGAQGDKALLLLKDRTGYDRWAGYLSALNYVVFRADEADDIATLITWAAQADTVVVGKDWYIDTLCNLALIIGRAVGAELKAAFDGQVAAAGTPVQGLLDIPAASINPVEVGKILREDLYV